MVDTSFTWSAAWDAVGGGPDGPRGVNIADRVIDRHVRAGRGDHVALRWFGRDDVEAAHPVDITYAELAQRTNRFASALHRLGFASGSGVATLAGRIPELFVAALGALRAECIFTPLFSAFGPDPIAQRLSIGRVRVLVTTPVLFRRKVVPILDRLPDLELVVIADATATAVDELRSLVAATDSLVNVVSFGFFLGEGSDSFDTPATRADTPALLHFTSGTTGEPKGAIHVHEAVVVHHATGRSVLDLHEGDVYWCTADPGWVTGTSYGIVAPLAHGVVAIVDEADFDAERWYRMLVRQRVNVFYTAPTAIRMLERVGEESVRQLAGAATGGRIFPDLRLVASVGEPLDADSVVWCQRVFQVPVLDNWWQTETGGIMIANRVGDEVRPGSMGRPVPGIEATLLQRDPEGLIIVDEHGAAVEVTEPGTTGELALRAGWPSMFRGYLGRDERYRSCFVGGPHGWYRSGDLARRDTDGYFWFVGRGDDVIKTAGHLIGPFEVESVLDEHPAVVESGVIGKPDPTMGAMIKAFVVLHHGYEPTDQLRSDLLAHCRRRLGAAVAPREIEFAESLPHTRSGKIMRRVLKARELGEDEGDTSTLETSGAGTEGR